MGRDWRYNAKGELECIVDYGNLMITFVKDGQKSDVLEFETLEDFDAYLDEHPQYSMKNTKIIDSKEAEKWITKTYKRRTRTRGIVSIHNSRT